MSPGSNADGISFRDPNLAGALAYLFGLVSGLVILAIDRREYVRFHAMQSTIFFLGVMAFFLVLTGIPFLGAVLYWPLMLAVAAVWLSLMFSALSGRRNKLPFIGNLAERKIAHDTSRP